MKNETKRCAKCKYSLDVKKFYLKGKFTQDRQSWCIECTKKGPKTKKPKQVRIEDTVSDVTQLQQFKEFKNNLETCLTGNYQSLREIIHTFITRYNQPFNHYYWSLAKEDLITDGKMAEKDDPLIPKYRKGIIEDIPIVRVNRPNAIALGNKTIPRPTV